MLRSQGLRDAVSAMDLSGLSFCGLRRLKGAWSHRGAPRGGLTAPAQSPAPLSKGGVI